MVFQQKYAIVMAERNSVKDYPMKTDMPLKRERGSEIMASVFDVAKYILCEQGDLSAWKLQKLCYYSQAWHLAWTGHPIFDEDFEAWANGPVCRELFHEHKGLFIVKESDIKKGSADNLSDDEKDSINVVLGDYGKMEPYDLRELSHREAPWKKARGGLPEGVYCENIISKTSMGEYYGSL